MKPNPAPLPGPKDKLTTIIVNARPHEVEGKEIGFAAVVALAFPAGPVGPNVTYTVTYRKAEGQKPEGSLVDGQSAKIKEGTTFNVTATDKS